jgi:hypothetical protein
LEKIFINLNIIDYCRIVAEIRNLNSFNEIIKSDFDYDNLYIVIESIINTWFLKIWKNWKFIWKWLLPNKNKIKNNVFAYNKPNSEFNQFPCTLKSRQKRIDLFFEKFPYTKKMNILIIWDDDLLSIELVKTWIYIPIVYEIDENIIRIIQGKNIQIFKWNILDKNFKIFWWFDTFLLWS